MPLPQYDGARARLDQLEKHLDLESKTEEVRVLEGYSTREDFWNDNDQAQNTLKKIRDLKEWIEGWQNIHQNLEDLSEMYDMAKMESDEDLQNQILSDWANVEKELKALELKKMLSGPDDACGAIVTINPGAGGTESQDWASMLYRMYKRYFERKNWNVKLLDYQDGDEAGIKTATFEINTEYAYGFLRSEVGVHRLVRISPFDANAKRHTSFAAVFVYPILEDIEFEIEEKDIRVDTYRASGAGGQHVNKTDSAVRMTHIPTGIVTTCQNERSQIQNRAKALEVLKSLVYNHIKAEEEAKRDSKLAEKRKIEWGSQIRNYVLHPYNMVKDGRTGCETSDAQGVLDGDIQDFIESYLIAESTAEAE
jgi:peptide chain release factor 2